MHQRPIQRGLALFVCLCAVVFPSLAFAQADEAQWGTLRGRFVYDGEPPAMQHIVFEEEAYGRRDCDPETLFEESLQVSADGGLANVVVYLRTRDVNVHPCYEATAEAEVVQTFTGCRIVPRIVPVRVTQTLRVMNADQFAYSPALNALGDVPNCGILVPLGELEHRFHRSQPVPVAYNSDIHPWMKGYVLPRVNPYTAISALDGTFTLENLPVGKLEFQVWHERSGALSALPEWEKGRFTLQIVAGDNNDLGDVRCAPAWFELDR